MIGGMSNVVLLVQIALPSLSISTKLSPNRPLDFASNSKTFLFVLINDHSTVSEHTMPRLQ